MSSKLSASALSVPILNLQFYNSSPDDNHLIKALHPFDRLNLDFKGPLPSVSSNKYLLNIVDEYSRFMWAYPCQNVETKTVIKCLTDLFAFAT